MGGPVEIEFAVNLDSASLEPKEFGFLQIRPLTVARDGGQSELGEDDPDQIVCRSTNVLGNGARAQGC
jgi:hypothetical protein